jgi:sugar/nucleoside kinase (ribokinase family)
MAQPIGPFDSVTVFGGATIDRVGRSATAPNAGASNPGTIRAMPGGVGLNLATILARLGLKVRLVARIGSDTDGQAIVATAETAGVDTSAIGISPTAPTARYLAALDHAGGLIVGIADMGVYEEITPSVVAPIAAAAPPGEAWLIDANLPSETIAYLIGEAGAARRPIAALTVSPKKAVRFLPHLDRLTLLFTNRREGAALLGHAPEEAALPAAQLARALASPLAGNVVVSDAAEPLAVATGGEVRTFAPLKADVRSVNGAGDALAAGMIFGLSRGRTLFEAALDGLAAAAITLESDSAVAAKLDPAALVTRIADRRLAS